MDSFIVVYTLKSREGDMEDKWRFFNANEHDDPEMEARRFMGELVEEDGGRPGFSLFTFALTKVVAYSL